MPTAEKPRKQKRKNPNLGFVLDHDLNALIEREKQMTPFKSKSMIIRDRLRQSYQNYPLDKEVR
jgi:spore coat protein CotF